MSPEIALGSKYYANSDIFSLGVTIYQLITKDNSTSISHLMVSKGEETAKQTLLTNMTQFNYSEELMDIVLKMVERDNLIRPNAQDILALPYFRSKK